MNSETWINYNGFVNELTIDIIFFRLLLAVVFGGIVGFEREIRNRPAGFRTHILVCFGAAVVSMIQDQLRLEVLEAFVSEGSDIAELLKSDLGRLGAQVISGIGFLGAGSIIKGKKDYVEGMTTAAGIWVTGCVGLGIGWGFYNIAVVAIVFMLVVMIILKRLENKVLHRHNNEVVLEIEVNEKENILSLIEEYKIIFSKKIIEIKGIKKDLENKKIFFTLHILENEVDDVIIILSKDNKVKSVQNIN